MSDRNSKFGLVPPLKVTVVVNSVMIYLAGLTVTVIFFLASFQPHQLLLPTMSSFLVSCALAACVLALVRVQRLNAPFVTFWDLAAIWLFLALGLGLLTDQAAVDAYNASIAETVATDSTAKDGAVMESAVTESAVTESAVAETTPPAPPATN